MSERFVIVAGKAGTGKTTLAKAVAQKMKYPYFDYDTLVQPFLLEIEKKYGIGNNRADFYKNWRKASYKTLWDVCTENILSGLSIVLSAPLSEEMKDAHFFDSLMRSLPKTAEPLLVYMAPAADMHWEMIKQRGLERDASVLSDRKRFNADFGAVIPQWPKENLLYLNSGNFGENLKQVLSRLK